MNKGNLSEVKIRAKTSHSPSTSLRARACLQPQHLTNFIDKRMSNYRPRGASFNQTFAKKFLNRKRTVGLGSVIGTRPKKDSDQSFRFGGYKYEFCKTKDPFMSFIGNILDQEQTKKCKTKRSAGSVTIRKKKLYIDSEASGEPVQIDKFLQQIQETRKNMRNLIYYDRLFKRLN